jgi:DeoR/GlpR family transcriptional regulator of sugar metabolism
MARKIIERLERIDQLLRMKATGTPRELAARLNISESTLYDTLQLMKEKDCPIIYDKLKRTYHYDHDGRLEIRFKKIRIT